MNICFHANCQALGLQYFFERSPSSRDILTSVIQDFQVVLGETSKEKERAAVESADIIFYHAIGGKFPVEQWKPKRGVKLIPMSVWYNSGPFLSGASQKCWSQVLQVARKTSINDAIHYAVHEADMGYSVRWASNLRKMEEKERIEKVPKETAVSQWTAEGIERQMHLTMNHPTTEVFFRWANLLLRFIGFSELPENQWASRFSDMNLVGLPCEDYACSGAFNQLGLGWGGDEKSNLWNYEFVKKKLKECALEENNSQA